MQNSCDLSLSLFYFILFFSLWKDWNKVKIGVCCNKWCWRKWEASQHPRPPTLLPSLLPVKHAWLKRVKLCWGLEQDLLDKSGLSLWLHWGSVRSRSWRETGRSRANFCMCKDPGPSSNISNAFDRRVVPGWCFLLPGFLLATLLPRHLAISKSHQHHLQDIPTLHHKCLLNPEPGTGGGNTLSGNKKRNDAPITRIKLEWQHDMELSRARISAKQFGPMLNAVFSNVVAKMKKSTNW